MVAILDSFVASLGPVVEQAIGVIIQFLQLGLLLGVIGYGYMLYRYDIKINVREYSKGGRTITYTTRAVKIRDKRTGAPKLKFFGTLGLRGEIINEPPAECLVAHRSRITNKMYDFIKKNGLYYPVENIVLGIQREVEQNVVKEFIRYDTGETFQQVVKEKQLIYTLEGSGLVISRDYDAEQAIQNTLIEKASIYRNRKPTEIIASFALMIITIVVSGVVMWFAWKQFGNIAVAIEGLKQPLKEGLIGAAQGILGPG